MAVPDETMETRLESVNRHRAVLSRKKAISKSQQELKTLLERADKIADHPGSFSGMNLACLRKIDDSCVLETFSANGVDPVANETEIFLAKIMVIFKGGALPGQFPPDEIQFIRLMSRVIQTFEILNKKISGSKHKLTIDTEPSFMWIKNRIDIFIGNPHISNKISNEEVLDIFRNLDKSDAEVYDELWNLMRDKYPHLKREKWDQKKKKLMTKIKKARALSLRNRMLSYQKKSVSMLDALKLLSGFVGKMDSPESPLEIILEKLRDILSSCEELEIESCEENKSIKNLQHLFEQRLLYVFSPKEEQVEPAFTSAYRERFSGDMSSHMNRTLRYALTHNGFSRLYHPDPEMSETSFVIVKNKWDEYVEIKWEGKRFFLHSIDFDLYDLDVEITDEDEDGSRDRKDDISKSYSVMYMDDESNGVLNELILLELDPSPKGDVNFYFPKTSEPAYVEPVNAEITNTPLRAADCFLRLLKDTSVQDFIAKKGRDLPTQKPN